MQVTTTSTVVYLHPDQSNGLYYEKELRAATVTHKHYIAGVAVVTLSGSTWATQYLHRDHLGSVTAITDHAGTVIERFAYDPWGKRRFPDGAADPNGTIRRDPTIAFATDRGFTNHEHLDGLGLIHMNGRIFDPTLARFTSADPHIQHADNMQSYNRYSYVLNNPLIYTDPTGYFLKKLFKGVKKLVQKILKNPIVRAVAAIAVAYFTGQWVLDQVFWSGLSAGYTGSQIMAFAHAVGGFAGGLFASGGDLKGAFQGALLGGAFGFVGARWHGGTFQNYAGHAVVGCASSAAQGGNCARGAAAQLASKWATINTKGNPVAAVVAGGTVSVIGGGKFANGAQTAAFLHMFRSTTDYFERNVGGNATLAPGRNPDSPFYVPDPVTGQQPAGTWDNNVFGDNDPGYLCSQGSLCSRFFNLIPGLNGGVARLHDYWLNSMKARGLNVTAIDNVGTMVPAAVVGYAAIIGTPLQALSTQQIICLSVSNSFDRDDRRRNVYYGAAVGAQ